MNGESMREPLPELVVLSHLSWSWVWQRPQHLISRLAAGYRTWFVEEPVAADVTEPELASSTNGAVPVVQLQVPQRPCHGGFDAPAAEPLAAMLTDVIATPVPMVWLYT